MKKLEKYTKQKGFTIIEITIVLAIAGLILLLVFLAVPALQRNSRNTQVRNDVAKALGVLNEAITNNNGTAPQGTTPPTAVTSETYAQLNAFNYNVDPGSFQALPASLAAQTLYIRNFSTCGGGGNGQMGVLGGSIRQITGTFLVESKGTGTANGVPSGYTAQCSQL